MLRRVSPAVLLSCFAALAVLLVTPALPQWNVLRQSDAVPASIAPAAVPTTVAPATGHPALLSPAPVPPATGAAAPISTEIHSILQQGHQLELEGNWEEALSHYEGAMRQHPGDHSVRRRFDFVRLHYDLGRRYVDRSFLDALATMPAGRALDLYSQVLLKIQAHYVEMPNWKDLVERGTNCLDVALSEAAFCQRHLPGVDQQSVQAFRRELYGALGPRVVGSRNDARDAVSLAAGLAQQRLGISPTAIVLEYLCGATNTLDPYSAYLTPDQLGDVYSQINGNFVGLGIELKADAGALLIVRVIGGSPAEESGLRAGDRIVAVDGRTTAELTTDGAANMLQGEEGSVVELTLVTPPHPPRQVQVRRRRVEVPSVDGLQIVDPSRGIAYLRLACFQKTTRQDLDTAMRQLHGQGMRSLIVDVRGNPGGLLTAAVEASDLFIERGIIVSTRGRGAREDFTYSAQSGGTWGVPLVVLIDHDSASAAEIFAGAVRDHRRGTIVGQRSYGKGSVQGIFQLHDTLAGIRLTTAKFYSPTGRPYSWVGVEPHVAVHTAARPTDDGRIEVQTPATDETLAAAVQTAQRFVRPR